MYQYVVAELMKDGHCPDSILDIGCSIGYGTHILSIGIGEAHVIGIDIEQEKIKESQRLFDDTRVAFEQVDITNPADAARLAEKEGPFDVVVCFEVLEHIPPEDSRKLLKNVKDILKSGGLLFMSTPNKDVYDIDAYSIGHINEMPCDRFLQSLKAAGFRLLEVKGIYRESAVSSFLLRKLHFVMREGDQKATLTIVQKLLRKAIVSFFNPKTLLDFVLRQVSRTRYFKWKYNTAINTTPKLSHIVLVKACHK